MFERRDKALERLKQQAEDINHMLEAHRLLEKVYLQIGAYRDGEVEDEIWSEVRDFFGFDDGE